METSHFSHNQDIIDNAQPLDVNGSTCECFRVKHYGKQLFLKRLKPELRTHPRYVASLHKEFETGYSLDHPHMVRYMECGDDYLLTEWVDGVTLSEFAKLNPKFFDNRKDVSNMLHQLLDVVEYLHSHQIVHLDLKPQNILITRIGHELKLTDLGFCYTDTFADTMGSTDAFAAPEQLEQGTDVDHRTDIYALGRIIATLPCAKSYRRAIERCTQPRKEDRYQSIAELRKDIMGNRSKWKWIAAAAAMTCLIALTAWLTNSKPMTENTAKTITDTTTATSTADTATTPPAETPAIITEAPTAEAPIDDSPTTTLPGTVDNQTPSASKPAEATTATGHAAPINKDKLMAELIAATQPIYDKYLKQYEKYTTIDNQDRTFKDNYNKCDNEIADKLFHLYETKYKPMGVLESDYNPIAVKVIFHYTGKVDGKIKY